MDLVVFGNAANERVDPVIRQAGGQPHAGFDKLRVDFIVDVHMGCFFRKELLGEVMRSVFPRVKQRLWSKQSGWVEVRRNTSLPPGRARQARLVIPSDRTITALRY